MGDETAQHVSADFLVWTETLAHHFFGKSASELANIARQIFLF